MGALKKYACWHLKAFCQRINFGAYRVHERQKEFERQRFDCRPQAIQIA
jgi:hypothetical protein